MARKLQQQEEEESQWRRDVSDLSTRLAVEARDRELAQALQEKEKARLRKAKEKARLKSQQKAAQQHEEGYAAGDANFAHPQLGGNIAACIDPTWSRRQNIPQAIVHAPNEIYRPLPMTDLGGINSIQFGSLDL